MIKIFLDFLFPENCVICKKNNSNFLCQDCFKLLSFKKIQCPTCNNFSKIGEFCQKCKERQELEGVLIAANLRDKNLNKIIKKYKYSFLKKLSIPLSLFLIRFLQNNIIKNPILKKQEDRLDLKNFILIPVPLSRKRLTWRGFNQSEELSKIISKKLNIKLSLDLKRIKHKTAQAKLNKKNRSENIKNCFKWYGESLKNKKILIVDDIFTSGATLNEIAKELKKYQALEIWGLVLAHG